jgi:Putative prokaryotic signal transducing protein
MAEVLLSVVGEEIEAEDLCGLLRTNGIKCYHRRGDQSAGIAGLGAGFTIAGPFEVFVDETDLAAAQELLPSS